MCFWTSEHGNFAWWRWADRQASSTCWSNPTCFNCHVPFRDIIHQLSTKGRRRNLKSVHGLLFMGVWIDDMFQKKKNGCRSQVYYAVILCHYRCIYIWVFPKIVVPKNGWLIMEIPIRMDDLGVSLFSETPIYCLFWVAWFIASSAEPKRWIYGEPSPQKWLNTSGYGSI